MPAAVQAFLEVCRCLGADRTVSMDACTLDLGQSLFGLVPDPDLGGLVGLLDEWTPIIEGSELGEHPYSPITPESIRRAAASGTSV